MTERIRFTVGGKPTSAEARTSLLAALWNDGARSLRTSVAGEPRGPLCAMGTCFECRVTVDGEPHLRSCLTPVRDGMSVSLRDAGPVDLSGTARAADASAAADNGPLEAEVVVVGSGPAGISAAVHAAESGARTLIVDTLANAGGQIWRHRGEPPGAARRLLERLERARIVRLAGATVVDGASGELLLVQGGRGRRVLPGRLVLATGARELFLPFPGWTLPGVVGTGGAQALYKAGADFSGQRVVVAGSGPLLPAVAATLAAGGARIVGVAEQAPLARLAAFAFGLWRAPGKLAEGLGYAARLAGAPYRAGSWVESAEAQGGVLRATLTDGRRSWTWDCEVLACGYGLVANLELPRLIGCETRDEAVVTDAAQRTSVEGVFAAGELCGIAGVDQALATGAIAGLSAAGREIPPALAQRAEAGRTFGIRLGKAFRLREELRRLAAPETLVCRCEDVAAGRCAEAASSREAKLQTRAGMGPCQGRVCGPALAFLHGWSPDSARPPLSPVPIGALMREPERPAEREAPPARI